MPNYTYLYTAEGVCTYVCVLTCVYYSNSIIIMSNICDSTDTSSCTYSYFMVNYTSSCIVFVVVDACIVILQEFYVILHTEPLFVTTICI